MRDGYLGGLLARPATQRQMDLLAAFVAAGESHARSDLPLQVSLSAEHQLGARERPERPYKSAGDSQRRARIGPGRVRSRCEGPRCLGGRRV